MSEYIVQSHAGRRNWERTEFEMGKLTMKIFHIWKLNDQAWKIRITKFRPNKNFGIATNDFSLRPIVLFIIINVLEWKYFLSWLIFQWNALFFKGEFLCVAKYDRMWQSNSPLIFQSPYKIQNFSFLCVFFCCRRIGYSHT